MVWSSKILDGWVLLLGKHPRRGFIPAHRSPAALATAMDGGSAEREAVSE
jgi:hypothetical protein